MKKIFAIACASSALVAIAHAETRAYDYAGFTTVDASAGVNVEITIGGDFEVRAEGVEKALDTLRIEINGDALEIGRRSNGIFNFRSLGKAVVYVTAPSLETLKASSGADVTAKGIDIGEFKVSVSSGADADLSGVCGTLTADGASGADLDAENLECANAIAKTSSGADLVFHASQDVEASASSGGDITIYGDPRKTNFDESSGGDITIRR